MVPLHKEGRSKGSNGHCITMFVWRGHQRRSHEATDNWTFRMAEQMYVVSVSAVTTNAKAES